MIHELKTAQNSISINPGADRLETVRLYPGIELSYLTVTTEKLSMHHAALDHILAIDYCRSGRIGWEMGNGAGVYMGPSDFSLHTLKACADSVMTLPNGAYEGLTISIDLKTLSENPPELLSGTGITGELLYDKFCRDGTIASFAGNEKTEQIFSAFYDRPNPLKLSYQKLKTVELLLFLGTMKSGAHHRLTEYGSEQIRLIREIHDQLTAHMDRRFTIEELAKQYLINPTTLKILFKSVYGTSIAAHIREHRMQHAAKLLCETDLSIAQIAGRVGYDSQSRFSSAFRSYFGKLPKEYKNSPHA